MGPITTTILGVVGTVASVGGTVLSMVGQRQAGDEARAQAERQAQVEERQAQDTRAIAQRQAAHRAKEARLLQSNLIASNANSGGGGLEDSTIMNLWNSIGQQSTYQTASIISDSDRVGSGLEYQGVLDRAAGRQAQTASRWNMGSSLLSGASSFAKYMVG